MAALAALAARRDAGVPLVWEVAEALLVGGGGGAGGGGGGLRERPEVGHGVGQGLEGERQGGIDKTAWK